MQAHWEALAAVAVTNASCKAIEAIQAQIAGLEEKLKNEAEGHEGWEQEHLRHSAIQRAAIKACLDRLRWVSSDSESAGFIESCQPVIAQAEAALNIEP